MASISSRLREFGISSYIITSILLLTGHSQNPLVAYLKPITIAHACSKVCGCSPLYVAMCTCAVHAVNAVRTRSTHCAVKYAAASVNCMRECVQGATKHLCNLTVN